MRAGNHLHATIDLGRGIDSQPNGYDFHRIDLAIPVGGVLMPGNAFPISLRLADEVGGKERDVWTDDRFDKRKDVFIERILQQLGMHEVGNIHGLWTLVGGEVGKDALEAVLEGLKAVRWKDWLVEYEVSVIPVLRDFVGIEAWRDCSGCGAHKDSE